MVSGVPAVRIRTFSLLSIRAMLRGCPDLASAWACCLTIFTSSRSRGRPPKHDVGAWTVTDDWPASVPITDAELDVFEAWFGDLFDELFGPSR
jgi:hypothetical protein